jgi:hypothetical protein
MTTAVEPVSQPTSPVRPRSKPLLPVRGVMSLVDKNEDQVLRLIDEGKLAWVWDVRLDTKRGRNKELRILPACVAGYLRGQPCTLEWPDVLRLLLPHDEAVIQSKDITRILNVCGTHTYHLARRKLLAPCSTWRRGRGGCGRFTAKSFVEFIRSRRYP